MVSILCKSCVGMAEAYVFCKILDQFCIHLLMMRNKIYLTCLLQTEWFLLRKLKRFDLSELFDKCKSLNTCT